MAFRRTYSAGEVRELVDLFKDDPEMPPERYAGMALIAAMLEEFETKSDADIEQLVLRYCRATRDDSSWPPRTMRKASR